jgi:hypothetical protein
MKRRAALRFCGPFLLGSVAGCSALASERPMLDLRLFNQTETPYTVELQLYDAGSDQSRSEARSYAASIDVAPEGETRRADVAEVRHSLVQYEVYGNDSRLTDEDHVHFYPSDGGGEESLVFDVRSPGELTRR